MLLVSLAPVLNNLLSLLHTRTKTNKLLEYQNMVAYDNDSGAFLLILMGISAVCACIVKIVTNIIIYCCCPDKNNGADDNEQDEQTPTPLPSHTRLATIERILALTPIPNADAIECAQVLGWSTVVRKGEFAVGDLCVWHCPDTVVDISRPRYALLAKSKGRIRTLRLRGQVSQGLALPLHLFPELVTTQPSQEHADVTDDVGIRKYEKPAVSGNRYGALYEWPTFLRKTDEPNLRNYPDSLVRDYAGKEAYVTMKCDGSSITMFLRNGVFGVCQRNFETRRSDVAAAATTIGQESNGDLNNEEEPAHLASPYWTVAVKYAVERRMRALGRDNIAIQGEMCGHRVNGDHMKIGSDLRLYIFNVWDIETSRYLDVDDALQIMHQWNDAIKDSNSYLSAPPLVWVPFLWRGIISEKEHTLAHWIALANDLQYPNGAGPAEGIVLRTTREEWSTYLKNRVSTKIISEAFALKYGE